MKIVKIFYTVGAAISSIGLVLQILFSCNTYPQICLLGLKMVFVGIIIVFAGMVACLKILL